MKNGKIVDDKVPSQGGESTGISVTQSGVRGASKSNNSSNEMSETKKQLIKEMEEGKGLGARMAVRELNWVKSLWRGEHVK